MKAAGRVVALFLLLQGVCGPVLNFVLLQPVLAAPGFLVNAAAHPMKLGLAVLMGLLAGAMSIGIAVASWPAVRAHSERFAVGLVVAAVVAFVLMAVEMSGVLAMSFLARAHAAAAAAADADRIAALVPLVSALRNGSHFLGLMAGCATGAVLYAAYYSAALVPRWLAAVGFLAALLALVSAALPLFGGRVALGLMAPLGIVHLVLAGVLLWRGFGRSRV